MLPGLPLPKELGFEERKCKSEGVSMHASYSPSLGENEKPGHQKETDLLRLGVQVLATLYPECLKLDAY